MDGDYLARCLTHNRLLLNSSSFMNDHLRSSVGFFLVLSSVRSVTASLFVAFITSHPHSLPLTLFICYPLCLFFELDFYS